MTAQRWRTDNRIWKLAAGVVFVALGFVDPLVGATWNARHSLYGYFGLLFEGVDPGAVVLMVLFRSLLQVIPAVLVGWVLQAFVVIGLSWARGRPEAGIHLTPKGGK